MSIITKYIKGALVALFVFLGIGFKHFKDKSNKLEADLEAQRQRNTKQRDQIKTHLEQEAKARESIKKAEADSYINRDYFE